MRAQRRLALIVLLAAAVMAVAAFPVRATWWGGWLLAIAEAGIVGGLADWFAVTALFRHPLGIPIPHTALIPANWQLLAQRVGTMVGDRVLTREYLIHEISRLDVAENVARAAARVTRHDLEAATRTVVRWVAREFSPATAGDFFARARRVMAAEPVAPVLASALETAHQYGWDQRALSELSRMLAVALERPRFREAVGEIVDDLLVRYREQLPFYPRLAFGMAAVFGLMDRERIVNALQTGLLEVVRDPEHPVREQLGESAAKLGARLRTDWELIERVESLKRELLGSSMIARLAEEAAVTLRRALLADLENPRSETVTWLTNHLDRARHAVVADARLRADLDRWIKTRATEMIERYHGEVAMFIEKGVHALGPEGAVRLIEEHAGDDLQFIRVNGTVVGGLAGGALYAIHLLLKLL